MSVSLFDPFVDVKRLHLELDRLADKTTRSMRVEENGRVWRPAVDLFESDEALTLKMEVSGVDRDSFDVQLVDDELVVRGERKRDPEEPGVCVHAERARGKFQRVFRVGVPIQNDRVEASYRDGILTVRLPKAEAARARKVEVKVEAE